RCEGCDGTRKDKDVYGAQAIDQVRAVSQKEERAFKNTFALRLEKKALTNSVDPDETPHDAASHQGLRCLLTEISSDKFRTSVAPYICNLLQITGWIQDLRGHLVREHTAGQMPDV
ncbi:hypothetical protein DPMN_050748, partial [Dreissena polymorpha]